MPNSIATYLKYANVQMAAEALYDRKSAPTDATFGGAIRPDVLTVGNERASKFTATQATEFAANWTVVEHKSNTATGFSGTLFRYTGETDAAQGLVKDQLVLSFRSTEFADDSARDNQATNSMEIKPYGWAFGQIADMESWYKSLLTTYSTDFARAGGKFAVTGYSLGGHLATAFDLLRQEDGTLNGRVSETYTFNGAGVGTVKSGNTLTSVLADFKTLREDGSANKFTDAVVKAKYQSVRAIINGQASIAQIDAAYVDVDNLVTYYQPAITAPPVMSPTVRNQQLKLLLDALDRVKLVAAEALRAPGLSSGGAGSNPATVTSDKIDATKLDYQLAVLFAQEKTTASASLVGGGIQAVAGRAQGAFTLPNFYDVYGDTSPSAVANSQLHYGTPTPVFIEDQPVLRGSIIGGVVEATLSAALDIKLLVPGFSQNDFGDTHSLVLLQDSLNMQNTLAKLDTSLSQAKASAILQAAANNKAEWSIGTQGKADGDTLEKVLNALADSLGLGWTGTQRLKGSLDGNTWALTDDASGNTGRTTFYAKLKLITDSAAYKALAGKTSIMPIAQAGEGKSNFGTFLALNVLSPFALQTTDATALAKLKQGNEALAQLWEADLQLTPTQLAAGQSNFSSNWYTDRQALLQNKQNANTRNVVKPVGNNANGTTLEYSYFDNSKTEEQTLTVLPTVAKNGAPTAYMKFGDDTANTISGASQADHLYGGAGNDTLDGKGGADYLEGNQGADTLNGGDNDKASDVLVGGAGSDTYQFTGTWGKDQIIDSDGLGQIKIDSDTLIGGKSVSKGVWLSDDKKYAYAKAELGGGKVDLIIARAGAAGSSASNDIITIKDFKAGDLGLTLEGFAAGGAAATPQPSGKLDIFANYPAYLAKPLYEVVDVYLYANGFNNTPAAFPEYYNAGGAYIAPHANPSRIVGLGLDDVLNGSPSPNLIVGMGGKDKINAGAGSDVVLTGLNAEYTPPPGWANEISSGTRFEIYNNYVEFIGVRLFNTNNPNDSGRANPATPYKDWAYDFGLYSPQLKRDGVSVYYRYDIAPELSHLRDGTREISPDFYTAAGSTVDGGEGQDLIVGGIGADYLYGGDGIFADNILGGYGNDFINGGDGDDFLSGDGRLFDWTDGRLHGQDILLGGAGNDTLVGGGNSDVLEGGDGNDVLMGDVDINNPLVLQKRNGQAITTAQRGDDYLDGGAGNDWLLGDAGVDTLLGGAGNDMLFGDDITTANSTYTLAGDAHGKDYLDGGDGDDQLVGGGNDDILIGGAGNDFLYGDGEGLAAQYQGNDYLDGGDGDDQLAGDGGNDILLGGAGNDSLSGGDGNDTLDGGSGSNWLEGGAGDDTYIAHAGDTITDTEGLNTIQLDALRTDIQASLEGGGTRLNLGGNSATNSILISSANTNGSTRINFKDGTSTSVGQLAASSISTSVTTFNDSRNANLYGGTQADTLYAYGSNSTVTAGKGNDNIYLGGIGSQVNYQQGDGVDTLQGGAAKAVIALGSGPDMGTNGIGFDPADLKLEVNSQRQLSVRFGSNQNDRMVLNINPDQLTQSKLVDRLTFEGMDGNIANTLSFTDLVARGIRVIGTAQDDTLAGTNANDEIAGGAGTNTLTGGAGNDVYVITNGSTNTVIDSTGAGEGNSIIRLAGITNWTNVLLTRADIQSNDLLLTAGGNTKVTLSSALLLAGQFSIELGSGQTRNLDSFLPDLPYLAVRGSNAADAIIGSDHGNALSGGGGDDMVMGGAGDDLLSGGDGNDLLSGKGGDDILFGGAGDDVFVMGAGGGHDQVFDYEGSNVVRFVDDITLMQLGFELTADTTDVRITLNANTSVVVYRALEGAVTRYEFADGTQMSYGQLINRFVGPNDSTVAGDDLDNTVNGTAGNDLVLGNRGNDLLNGFAGDDVLLGGDGDDVLAGNTGNDVLNGGVGTDAYLFALGDGIDRLVDTSGASTIRFGAGIRLQDLSAAPVMLGSDAYIRLSYSNTDAILIKEGVQLPGNAFVFADGTSLSQLQVYVAARHDARINPAFTDNADQIDGYAGNDVLMGGGGDDRINGNSGDDMLDGGVGNDQLTGGTGDDTYVMTANGGTDTVIEAAGQRSTILLGAGDQTLLTYARAGMDLLLSNTTLNASFLIANFYGQPSTWTLKTAQGVELDLRALAIAGQAGKTVEQRREDFYNRKVAQSGPYSLCGQLFYAGGNREYTDGNGNEHAYTYRRERRLLESNGSLIEASAPDSLSSSNAVILRTTTTTTSREETVNDYTSSTTTQVTPPRRHFLGYLGGSVGGFTPAGFSYPGSWTSYQAADGAWYADEPATYATTLTPHYTTRTVTETQTNRTYRETFDGTSIIEDVRAGSGDNAIQLSGSASKLVTGGAGNDLVQRLGTTKDNTFDNRPGGPSDWVDGGQGDDTIRLGAGNDEISGGGGSDYLDGGAGSDTYVVASDDDGWDTIYDSAKAVIHVELVSSYYGYLDVDLTSRLRSLLTTITFDSRDAYVEGNRDANAPWYSHGGVDKQYKLSGDLVVTAANINALLAIDRARPLFDKVASGNGSLFSRSSLESVGLDRLIATIPGPAYVRDRGTTYFGSTPPPYWPTGPLSPAIMVTSQDLASSFASVSDTVIFGSGINLDGLNISWGVTETPASTKDVMLISWGGQGGIKVVMPSADEPGVGIENFDFADGTRLTMQQLLALAPARPGPGNSVLAGAALAPVVATEDAAFSYALPISAFVIGGYKTPRYSASLGNDGQALPAWLQIDPLTGTLTGTPTNGDVGNIVVKVTARQGLSESASQIIALQVSNTNDAPQARSYAYINQPTVRAGELLSWALPPGLFTDQDVNDRLSLHVELADGSALPAWLKINLATGKLEGRPVSSDAGVLSVRLVATDLAGASATIPFSINILPNSNHAPLVGSSIANQQLSEDLFWQFLIPAATFNDVDGDALTYTATLSNGSPLPVWLSFNAATRTFSGTPTNEQVGSVALAVTATDLKGLSVSANFTVTVNNTNDAPIVSNALASQLASQGANWSYTVPANTFTDVDIGDTLTLSANLANGTALPAWLSFDAATGTFSGRPVGANVGNLALKVTATDTAGAAASTALNVNVLSTNHAPVAAGLLDQQAIETQTVSYKLPVNTFTDADVGDSLTLRANLSTGAALPAWLIFNAATQTLSGTPPDTASGLLSVTITATDEQGATASSSFSLDIANIINGTALDDVLTGTVANDVIYGGLGADRMAGGKGNDVYYVDNLLDKVIEKPNEGRDTVHSTVSYTLAANVEDLVLDGAAAIDGTGNVLDNRIEGNAADNKLLGGDGNDTLLGGAGDDWLRGGAGGDMLVGGMGDDLYEVDSIGEVVIEDLNEGVDTVEASVTYSLSANVENLIVTGTLAIDGTGNSLDNTLQGNDAANVLTGGAGNDTLNGKKGLDTLIGGLGNDTYLLEDDVDTVVELAGGGRDTIISQFAFTLAANVEDGMLLGSAASIIGNELANVLTGNNAANTLDGGAGADVMLGGKGNDIYIVDSQADTVVENAGGGTDTVQSSVNYTLADNVENLILTGTAEAGMGNSLNNKITGNAASNKLFGGDGNDEIDGGAGADIMIGGLGNDKYWVDSSSDLVVEAAGEGKDTVYASVSYALADNVENLVLTGSANINAIGNAGNNHIEGNTGNNILFGGVGNDTYVFGRGSGRDIVANFDAGKPSGDKVQLGSGIVDADLNYLRAGNDLVLSIKGTNDQLTVAGYFENGGKGANALEKIRFADGMSLNHAAVLSRSTVGTEASAMSDAQSLPAGVRTGNPTALFDAPAPAATKTSDMSITPQSVAESINAVRQRFEQTLKNLKLGTDEQGSLSRSEFAERRALPLLWNLQDALLNLQLAKNADGRFTADLSIDSRATRDLGLGISLLGATSGQSGRLDQVARPAEIQQFDLAQLH